MVHTRILITGLTMLMALGGCDSKTPATGANREVLLDPQSAEMNKQAPDQFKAEFATTKGTFIVQIRRDWAPLGADRFYNLVRNGFYNDAALFRVLPGFVVQFGIHGDPEIAAKWAGHPQINPNYLAVQLKDEPVKETNRRGTLSYAKGGPNSRTTQVFVNLADNARLDKMGFSPFGEVIEGIEVVESFHSEYGDQASQKQGEITQLGNEYLREHYPKLDYIETARLID
jgi:peptidyl-prolyl cis-trans isomerase A (cyclophilin A)